MSSKEAQHRAEITAHGKLIIPEDFDGPWRNVTRVDFRCVHCDAVTNKTLVRARGGMGHRECTRSLGKDYYINKIEAHGKLIADPDSDTDWKNASKVRVKCVICEESMVKVINKAGQGDGCKTCSLRKGPHYWTDQVASHGKVKVVGELDKSVENKDTIRIECLTCSKQEDRVLMNVARGYGCTSCANIDFEYLYIQLATRGYEQVLKFGVTSTPEARVNKINQRSDYEHDVLSLFHFPEKDAILAENEVKRLVESGVAGKTEMRDGHTETTHVANLQLILDIASKYGGTAVPVDF